MKKEPQLNLSRPTSEQLAQLKEFCDCQAQIVGEDLGNEYPQLKFKYHE